MRVFRTVVERGGFSAAEVMLNKSKSAISLDISNLEQRLGAVLCVRGRGGFALTEEGQIVYLASLQLFHDLDKFRDRIANGLQRLTGTVSMLLLDNIVTIASQPLSNALAVFGKRHPAVELKLESANSLAVERGILEGEADIGIAVVPRPLATLVTFPLFREELRLYCGRHHPLYASEPGALDPERVFDYPLIEPSVIDDPVFAAKLENFRISGRANSIDSRVLLVLSGMHLGFLPPEFAEPWIATAELREVPLPEMRTANTFYAIIKKSTRQTAAAQRLLQTILGEFKARSVGLPADA